MLNHSLPHKLTHSHTHTLTNSAAAAKRPKVPVLSPIRTRKSEMKNNLRARSPIASSNNFVEIKAKPKPAASASSGGGTKKQRVLISQEELLTECVTSTEPLNKKWVLGRRRMTDANEAIISAAKRNDLTGVKERFTSRGKVGVGGQAMFNTITFPRVDHVPDILKRSVTLEDALKGTKPNPRRNLMCSVNGVPAKYYDPVTKKGYSDLQSFREIRRIYNAGNVRTGFDRLREAAPKIGNSCGANNDKHR